MSRGAGPTAAVAKGLFGWIGVFVLRWPWLAIGLWVAVAAVLSVTFPPLTEMAAKRPVPILPSDAPVLVTTRQISEAFHQSGSENENVLLVVLTDEDGLNRSDLTTYRTLADNLRPDSRDIIMLQDFVRTRPCARP
jgi:RND superfamily putative drug exporter